MAGIMVATAVAIGRASPARLMLSYLFVFIFFTGLSVGSLALLMIHALTGGSWGWQLRQPLLAAARALPLQALLAVPVLGGMHLIYPWARSDVLAADALLRQQAWYLNDSFFVIRSGVYFLLWLIGLWAMTRNSGGQPSHAPGRSGVAAPGLIVLALTTLFAATDWIMSLMPHWHSTVFGMLIATGWVLSAAALAVLCSGAQHGRELGNLLLMLVLAWGYLAYMQYLTIWIADLPDENSWYLPRTQTSWRFLAETLFAGRFLLPFFLLLWRRLKRSTVGLASVAVLLILTGVIDAFWLTVPSMVRAGLVITPADILMLLGIGSLWLAVYQGQRRTPQVVAVPQHARG
jgi:hypothetical protein